MVVRWHSPKKYGCQRNNTIFRIGYWYYVIVISCDQKLIYYCNVDFFVYWTQCYCRSIHRWRQVLIWFYNILGGNAPILKYNLILINSFFKKQPIFRFKKLFKPVHIMFLFLHTSMYILYIFSWLCYYVITPLHKIFYIILNDYYF